MEAFLKPPEGGLCIPREGKAKKLAYKATGGTMELTLFPKPTRDIYVYKGQFDIPILLECSNCDEIYHASHFGVKDGKIVVSNSCLF